MQVKASNAVLFMVVLGSLIEALAVLTEPIRPYIVTMFLMVFHRYFASIAAGFGYLPASLATLEELLQQSRSLGLSQ